MRSPDQCRTMWRSVGLRARHTCSGAAVPRKRDSFDPELGKQLFGSLLENLKAGQGARPSAALDILIGAAPTAPAETAVQPEPVAVAEPPFQPAPEPEPDAKIVGALLAVDGEVFRLQPQRTLI